MRFVRWLKHALHSPRYVDRHFPPATMERITQAIAESESRHRGEIRVAIEDRLPWSYLKRGAPVRERAQMMFAKLRVWDTELNNGVLIYIELSDHRLEIVADRGIAQRVEQAQWDAIAAQMRERFAAARFEQGVVEAVGAIGALLAMHFAAADGQRNPNELPDRPAVLSRQ